MRGAMLFLALLSLPLALAGCDEGDGAVIEQLREAGADLSQPREVRYYLYLPTVADAEAVAEASQNGARSIQVEPAATGDDWLVFIVETVVVDEATMAARRNEFHALVDPRGGTYDGWEAAAQP
jgi:hypothetical protein